MNRKAQYQKLKRKFLEERPICQACGILFPKQRQKKATEPHHVRGRLGPLLCAMEYWLPVCRRCHRWIHNHPNVARELGFLAKFGDWNRYEMDARRPGSV